VVNFLIRGDAINGKIEHGRYYVAAKGRLTEVSRGVYLYSYVHTCSNFLLFPMTILSGFLDRRTNARKGKRNQKADSPED